MRYLRVAALSATVTICLLFSSVSPSLSAVAEAPRICDTPEELASYVLELAAGRKQYINVSIPNDLPEAGMNSFDLLKLIFRQDSGFIRWGHSGTSFTKTGGAEYTTFSYTLYYRTTKEQDEAAKKLASALVAEWKVRGLSGREKVDRLRSYISAHWRYDRTLNNESVYPTMISGKGTCLGFVAACQLILNEMDIPSQTVHGRAVANGELHIQLLVKLGERWYTFDPTGLAKNKPDLSCYLKSSYSESFAPASEYLTESFRHDHPMGR